jgi:Na+-transporting NADH:ubiquinone oxidoreductase subunit A
VSEFRFKKGYDVPMPGAPESILEDAPRPQIVTVRPNEFRAVKPKLLVQEGATVSIGTPLFQDRRRAEVRWVSPGAGEVFEIRYGRRRACQEIYIRLAERETYEEQQAFSPDDARRLSRAQIVEKLIDGGLWTSIRTRPYSLIPDGETIPDAIFVSASDSSPLPFDHSLALEGREEDFQLGVDLLGILCERRVHLCLARDGRVPGAALDAAGCEKHFFSGPHPSGQIEAQIHHVLPHKKGREVWYLDCQDAAAIGELFRTGRYPISRVVAIGGEGATVRKHFRTRRGITPELLDPDASPSRNRFISGSPLSGRRVGTASGLGHYDCKFCVVPEGDEPEFVGWMLPGFDKISRYRAYASTLVRPEKPHITTALGGGERAQVATGIYEEVCAVDILPAYLMRALVADDLEEAESLGLADCAECGLCTYVCPSKIEFGEIIQRGILEILKEHEE